MMHLPESKNLKPQIMKEAETFIVKGNQRNQRNFYLEDIDASERKSQIYKNSNLVQMNSFLNSYGTLRVGGRLQNVYLSQTEKNPTILPGQFHLAKLMMFSCHERYSIRGGT